MKQIRRRPLIDNIDAQRRSASGRMSRTIYLFILSAFFIVLIYYIAGGSVVLSADGIVLNTKRVVATSYPATVARVLVSEGDAVEKGTVLVELESFDMVKEIADLSVRASEFAVREVELRSKATMISSLLPLAQRARRESGETVEKLDTVVSKGLVAVRTRDEAVNSSYQAAERLAMLTAQAQDTEAQLNVVIESQKTAANAVSRLKDMYDEGIIRAMSDGVIGSRVPSLGQFVRPGDELLQINGGNSYLLAYLPDEYLYSLRQGTNVYVSAGSERIVGTVDKVLQIADALPAEFQNMMRPRDRSRLIRVTLPQEHPFAVSQKVVVRGCIFGWCWLH